MYAHRVSRTLLPVLASVVLLSACETAPFKAETAPTFDLASELVADKRSPIGGDVAAQLAAVRNLTAPFHKFDTAVEAGWSVPLSPCVEHDELGGMGYHYGNLEYLENGYLDALQPEVLLYVPRKNGQLRLVGVEYIVPFAARDTPGDQPSLFGQPFDYSPHVGPAGSWTLHVWLWRNNPSGMFAAFNPNVSCEFAS